MRFEATLQIGPGLLQAFAEPLKADDLLVDRTKPIIDDADHRLRVGTRGSGISDELQHAAYLGKAEA